MAAPILVTRELLGDYFAEKSFSPGPNYIPASWIGDGTVSDTEYLYLNGVTGPIQTQIDDLQAQIDSLAGAVHFHDGADINSGVVAVEFGGTGADLDSTGGAGHFVKQETPGGAFTVEPIVLAELPADIEWSYLLDLNSSVQDQIDALDAAIDAIDPVVSLDDITAGTLQVPLNIASPMSVTAANRQIIGTPEGIAYNVPDDLYHRFGVNGAMYYHLGEFGMEFALGSTIDTAKWSVTRSAGNMLLSVPDTYGAGLAVNGTNRLLATNTGVSVTGIGTFSGDVVTGMVRRATTDGADTNLLLLSGGGADGQGRGASLELYGNDHPSLPGEIVAKLGSAGYAFNFVDKNGDTPLRVNYLGLTFPSFSIFSSGLYQIFREAAGLSASVPTTKQITLYVDGNSKLVAHDTGLNVWGTLAFQGAGVIHSNTLDGADGQSVWLAGGGGTAYTRGSSILVTGAENTGSTYYYLANTNGSRHIFYTGGGGEMFAIDATGVNFAGYARMDAGVLKWTYGAGVIRQDTTDGADTSSMSLAGGGGGITRGALVEAYGNEHATAPGELRLHAGATGTVRLYDSAGTERLRVITTGASLAGSLFLTGTYSPWDGTNAGISHYAAYGNIYATETGLVHAFQIGAANIPVKIDGDGLATYIVKSVSNAGGVTIQNVTTDGADTQYVMLLGGGGGLLNTARGASATVYGNEHATYPGQIRLIPGSTGTLQVSGSQLFENNTDYLGVNHLRSRNASSSLYIGPNTVDGSDGQVLYLCGGGVAADGSDLATQSRGANITLFGNESASPFGQIWYKCGNNAISYHRWWVRDGVEQMGLNTDGLTVSNTITQTSGYGFVLTGVGASDGTKVQIYRDGTNSMLRNVPTGSYHYWKFGGTAAMALGADFLLTPGTILTYLGDDLIIRGNTLDGADNRAIFIAAGGYMGTGRGGGIDLYGNEHATHPGRIRLIAGGTAFIQHYSNLHAFYDAAGTSVAQIDGTSFYTPGDIRTYSGPLTIGTNSLDTADNQYLELRGAGGAGNGRGAYIVLYGNENAVPGYARYYCGFSASAMHQFFDKNTENVLRLSETGALMYAAGALVAGVSSYGLEIIGGAYGSTNPQIYQGSNNLYLRLGNSGGQFIFYNSGGGTLMQTTTLGLDVYNGLRFASGEAFIGHSTADGADIGSVSFAGGGVTAGSISNTRGGYITAFGNEHSNTGQVRIVPGAVTGGAILLYDKNGANQFTFDHRGIVFSDAIGALDTAVNSIARTGDSIISYSAKTSGGQHWYYVNGAIVAQITSSGVSDYGNTRIGPYGLELLTAGAQDAARWQIVRNSTEMVYNAVHAFGSHAFNTAGVPYYVLGGIPGVGSAPRYFALGFASGDTGTAAYITSNALTLTYNVASAYAHDFKVGGTSKIQFNSSGMALTGDLVFSNSSSFITTNTSDGADNKAIILASAPTGSTSRGGFLAVYGNEYVGAPGQVRLIPGATGDIRFYDGSPVERLRIASSGAILTGALAAPSNTTLTTIWGGDFAGSHAKLYGGSHATKAGRVEIGAKEFTLAANTAHALAPASWSGIVIVTTEDGVGVYLCPKGVQPVLIAVYSPTTIEIGNDLMADNSSKYGIYSNGTSFFFKNTFSTSKSVAFTLIGEDT